MSTADLVKKTNAGHVTSMSSQAPHAAADPANPVESISVLSWNLWFGGLMMADGQTKQMNFLREQAADIICLQESVHIAPTVLADELGYGLAQQGSDTAILSRYPTQLLATETAPFATAAFVKLPSGPVLVWSVHLEHSDYGPYRTQDLEHHADQVFGQAGEQLRDQQIAAVLHETERLTADSANSIPVIISGDFNVPSPLDWNGVTRPQAAWPATSRMETAGYTDAFRAIHPDPVAAPGLTWSQIHTLEDEPRDRIDFVYTLGFPVEDCVHIGQTADADVSDTGLIETSGTVAHIPHHRANDFASDHLAVRATLAVN